MRILLIGGSKSGKSMLAQELCRRLAQREPRPLTQYYWATMEPTDGEDRARIARHLTERDGWGFVTIERGRELPGALAQVSADSVILFDSVTALLANEMFGGDGFDEEAARRGARELLTVSAHPAHFVCVCDELWRDGFSFDQWTERYRRGLAEICRCLAGEFDTVCEVTAGMIKQWKGELPR